MAKKTEFNVLGVLPALPGAKVVMFPTRVEEFEDFVIPEGETAVRRIEAPILGWKVIGTTEWNYLQPIVYDYLPNEFERCSHVIIFPDGKMQGIEPDVNYEEIDDLEAFATKVEAGWRDLFATWAKELANANSRIDTLAHNWTGKLAVSGDPEDVRQYYIHRYESMSPDTLAENLHLDRQEVKAICLHMNVARFLSRFIERTFNR